MIDSQVYASSNSKVDVVTLTEDNIRDIPDWTSQARWSSKEQALELRLRTALVLPGMLDTLLLHPGDKLVRYENGRVDAINDFELDRLFRLVTEDELRKDLDIFQTVRKPNPVEAVIFTESNGEELAKWCKGTLGWVRSPRGTYRELTILLQPTVINSPEDVSLGEYVVREADGTFRRCTTEEFDREYISRDKNKEN